MSNIPNPTTQPATPSAGAPSQKLPPAVVAPVTTSSTPQAAKMDGIADPGGTKDATAASVLEPKTKFFKKKKKRGPKPPSYAHDVYKRRFKHFRTMRLLSLLVGGSILLVLILGMWQIYTMVFSTIEDTEHIFLITEKRRTHTIEFDELEKVRKSWSAKYSASTTPFTKPLFPLPPPVEPPSKGSDE